MSQFDVHRNRGQNRQAIPFVVIAQSSIFDDYRRRIVIPLVRNSLLDSIDSRFNPTFDIENTTVVLHPLEIVSVDANNLGKLVASLSEHRQQIADALDMLISRAHG